MAPSQKCPKLNEKTTCVDSNSISWVAGLTGHLLQKWSF